LDAQRGDGIRYAQKLSIDIVKEWSTVESAKKEGRKAFNEMVAYAKQHPEIQCLLFEKVDRMSRNYADMAKIEDLVDNHEKEVHFWREGIVLSKNCSPGTNIRVGIGMAVAKDFIANLRLETIKGLVEKARQGEWPCHAPCGYKNGYTDDLVKNAVREFEPTKAPWVRRAFELMATGQFTLERCRAKLFEEGCPKNLLPWKSSIEKWVRNSFYRGWIKYRGIERQGNHPRLISDALWYKANAALSRLGKPFHRQSAPYGDLMHCAACGCSITSEFPKKRYRYYRCTRGRGRCRNDGYFKEQKIEELLTDALATVHIDREVAEWITETLADDAAEVTAIQQSQIATTKAELSKLDKRKNDAFELLLDGRISQEFWQQKNNEWEEQRSRLNTSLQNLETNTPASYMPTIRKTLELANRLPDLLLSMEPEKRRSLINLVLLNLLLDTKTLRYDYAKPFDLLAKIPENKRWGPSWDEEENFPRHQTNIFAVLSIRSRFIESHAGSPPQIPPKAPWLHNNLLRHSYASRS
jgi:DNA invertase Pin-like site-specific DNA recombinase